MLQEEVNEVDSAFATNDENELIGELSDLIVISSNHIAQMGYDVDLVMKETVKKISSRKQDPAQAERWKIEKVQPMEKWLKWKNQPKGTIHIADYRTCKIQDV